MKQQKYDHFLVTKLLELYNNENIPSNSELNTQLLTQTDAMVDEIVPVQVIKSNQGKPCKLGGMDLFVVSFLKDERDNRYFSLSFFPKVEISLDVAHDKAVSAVEFMSQLVKYDDMKESSVVVNENMVVGWETYTGVERMGFIWSMIPVPGSRFGLRYSHRDVTIPMEVDIMVGRCYKFKNQIVFEKMNSVSTNRWYMKESKVIRTEIETDNGIRGTLFTPKSTSPQQYPGVIDLFGTAGGILEFRAALFASHGITCLALPYFAYKDLPESFYGLELEYFEVTSFSLHLLFQLII